MICIDISSLIIYYFSESVKILQDRLTELLLRRTR